MADGQVEFSAGHYAAAVPKYEEFVELWKKADPERQSRVRDARARLERLRAEIVRKG